MTDSRATEPVPDPGDEQPTSPGGPEPEPDVLLDVPELTVDEIRLAVDGLDADLSLRARLADLLQIDAGVRVHLTGVELDVTGVSAEALLKVRLENLMRILDRALTTIDRNPQLIDALARSATATLDDVHRLTAPVVNRNGRTVAAAGEVVERTGPARAEPSPPTGGDRAKPAPAAGARRPEPPPGSDAGRKEKAESGSAPAAGPSAGRPAEKKRGSERSGQPASATAEAAQLAGQAGQALRQAGRSVWEAIQGNPSQNRQPPKP
ncbi:hypothetical protein ACFYON_27010 [Micromonospora sp. NPDC005686]|uniref:hypothetical protein n=1 Tax=unclassified Micromonospora TaxID=2617518 RepID=UPI0033B83070